MECQRLEGLVFHDDLETDNSHTRVDRRPRERYNFNHVVTLHIACIPGVMVYKAKAHGKNSALIVVCRILTGQRYVDDILRPQVETFLRGLPTQIFLPNYTHLHKHRVV
ncbi:hypothetical protein TNCV_3560061 [Trichonephila clavipes]|uniref:Uncharacterized protein n=1 Tax=Trichonephila clavipes TaxID=2585209 RepID=A0A8X6WCI4_TRICX|nr:hypothetical protein TNCV_3560061 [Trichonephila clavipes]